MITKYIYHDAPVFARPEQIMSGGYFRSGNPDGADFRPSEFDAVSFIPQMMGKTRGAGIAPKIRMGLLVNGVDMNSGPSGTISAMHGEEEMAITVDAFRATIRALKREGVVS
jgi:glutamate-1-semialdehyde 2,1-aminomutase